MCISILLEFYPWYAIFTILYPLYLSLEHIFHFVSIIKFQPPPHTHTHKLFCRTMDLADNTRIRQRRYQPSPRPRFDNGLSQHASNQLVQLVSFW